MVDSKRIMGRRTATETLARVYQAFLLQRTWRQPELAARVGVSVDALRSALRDLQDAHMPLVKDEDGAHVFWSVPKSWFPGGVALDRETAGALVRELWRRPGTAANRRLLERLLSGLPSSDPLREAGAYLVVRDASGAEEAFLAVIEDARAKRMALHIQYYSTTSGLSRRHVSVQLVFPESPARFIAICHRAGELRWFRLDGVTAVQEDATTRYLHPPRDALEEFVTRSADGFHEGEVAIEHRFFVSDPDARWVVRNLFSPFVADPVVGGVIIRGQTAGCTRIARFVVGLGAAARAESEPLRTVVAELARGALAEATETSIATRVRKTTADSAVNDRAVPSIRRSK